MCADGQEYPSDLEEWVGCLADNQRRRHWSAREHPRALATGRGEGGRSRDYCEVNGPDGTLVFELSEPHRLLRIATRVRRSSTRSPCRLCISERWFPAGPRRGPTHRVPLGAEHRVRCRDPRRTSGGSPLFRDGARAQAVIDGIMQSAASERPVTVEQV